MSRKPIEVQSAYFIGANGERVELSDVVLPVVSDSTPDNSFTAFRIQETAEVTLTFMYAEGINALRVVGLRRYHFAKYHVYKCACRRKAQP